MTRADILETAKIIVTTDRNNQYGEPEELFGAISLAWDALDIARGLRERGPVDVALYMAALKLLRASSNPAVADSHVDAVGYAAIAGELAAEGLA